MGIFTREIFLILFFFFPLDKLNMCLVEIIGEEMNIDGKGLKYSQPKLQEELMGTLKNVIRSNMSWKNRCNGWRVNVLMDVLGVQIYQKL